MFLVTSWLIDSSPVPHQFKPGQLFFPAPAHTEGAAAAVIPKVDEAAEQAAKSRRIGRLSILDYAKRLIGNTMRNP
jgi:hypothetical protein